MECISGLKENDSLTRYSDSHNGRLPVSHIDGTKEDKKPFKDVLQSYIDKLEKKD